MAPPRALSFVLSAAFAATVLGQSQSGSDGLRIWGAVAFINHGEKTPMISELQEVLTPNGAQQMWRQGSAFRARYLNASDNLSDTLIEAVGSAPIDGADANILDNAQIDVLSADTEWISTGALAFMQGLYPPYNDGYNPLAGGEDLARNLGSNDSDAIQYPLDGYQYPKLRTASSLDSESPSVQGTAGCTRWSSETGAPLRERHDMASLLNDTMAWYQDIFSKAPLQGTVHLAFANFWNAYDLYELVSYLYNHNETVHDDLPDANVTLSMLEQYAYILEETKNTRQESDDNVSGDNLSINTVAGRTLAKKVMTQLKRNVSWDGSRDKLSVMFGSFQPLLAYMSLSGVFTGPSPRAGSFKILPKPGAAIVFELVSDASVEVGDGIDPEDLSVRFYYRASADETEQFEAFSLFGVPADTSIPYTAFSQSMDEIGLSSTQWCDVCGSSTAAWCSSSDADDDWDDDDDDDDASDLFGGSGKMSPVVAGLIGAIIMAAILGLAVAALFFLAGFRLRKVGKQERSSSLGGFKGAEKMPDDADVAVNGKGSRHERVGSWELRGADEEAPPTVDTAKILSSSSSSKEPAKSNTKDLDHDGDRDGEDGASVFGASIVREHESV